MTIATGTKLGRYEIRSQLGTAAFAIKWRALRYKHRTPKGVRTSVAGAAL